MNKNKLPKKKRKILRPFLKDDRMLERLKRYVGEPAFKSNETQMRSKFSGESRSKRRRKSANNSEKDLFYIDTKGEKHKSCSSADSECSVEEDDCKTGRPNVLNDSLRNVYSKTANKNDALAAIDDDVNTSSSSIYRDQNKSLASSAVIKGSKNFIKSKSGTESNNEKQLTDKGESLKKTDIPLKLSSVTFDDVGGLDNTLREICMLLLHLKHSDMYRWIGVKHPPRGILLHGPPGCGKTLIAHAIVGELELPFIEVAATELVSGVSGESESKIRELFERAVSFAPCIVFIDEIDAITPKREIAQREMEKRIVTQLLKCMDELNSKDFDTQVMVIGATNRPHALDPAVRRAGRFDREISIGIPNEAARLQILEVVCNKLNLSPNFDLKWLARNTPGYVGADLVAVTREAAANAVSRAFQNFILESDSENNNFTKEHSNVPLVIARSWLKCKPPLTEQQLKDFHIEVQDFEAALQVYVPSAKREGFATIPNVTWEDVGALKGVKEMLQTAILWPVKYQKEFKDFHLSSVTGVLLCGPKGCGKTLLAKAVANECSINFLSVKGPELLSMYVGESERAVRECFQRAKNSAPCVIFFDEIDALCPARSSSNENNAAERVVNQLLTEIDGIEGRKPVFVMGATNRPENIDSAMLRPGRFEKVIFIDVPNCDDRLDILKTITKNGTSPRIACDVSLESMANDDRCQGFSGADLESLVKEASFKAFKDYITLRDSMETPSDYEVKLCHFEYAFSNVKPSITSKDQNFFKNFRPKH